MINDPNLIFDGFSNCVGGVDAGRPPNLIDKVQVVQAENVAFRGGSPTTRPALTNIDFTFDNPNLSYNANGTFASDDGGIVEGENWFRQGNLQEATYYAPSGQRQYIMATIAGRYFRIQPDDKSGARVFEVKLAVRNRNNVQVNWHVQAGIYHIVQDGEASPIIYDGTAARRAGKDEIFAGKMMSFGMNRIVLIGVDDQIYFGDIRDGTGKGDADCLMFTETQFLNEGFPSAIPSFMGLPTAVIFLPQQDTSTGVGECLVFGETGVESFFLSLPREQWKDSQFQRTALLQIGNYGHRNVAVANNDVWFRSSDGWRAYRQASARVNVWSQLPLSTNVRQYIQLGDSWLNFGSAIVFNNRLYATTTVHPNQVASDFAQLGRPFNWGILSLDFDVLSSFGRESQPAWDGQWSNNDQSALRVTRLVTGNFNGRDRAFAFILDDDNFNALVEIDATRRKDTRGGIVSSIDGRAMAFDANNTGETEFNEKELYGGDTWIDQAEETVNVSVDWQPDQIGFWTHWTDFTISPSGTPGDVTPGIVPTITVGYHERKDFGKPPDGADPVMNRQLRLGFEHQCRITWDNHARIRKLRLHAQKTTERSTAEVG